ncbi:MAG: hypothetical protein MI919_40660 [Holophagales bacterium]|nr:hypothetical protein [Holophagales bacterium]
MSRTRHEGPVAVLGSEPASVASRGAFRTEPLIFAFLIALCCSAPALPQPRAGASGAAAVPGHGAASRAAVAAPEAPSWRRLDLEASKLFLTASTEVSLQPVASSKARAELMSSPRGKARVAAERGWKIAIDTSAMGRRSSEEILFDAAGSGLQRFKLRHGSKAYSKTYRFTDAGVFLLRTSPADVDEATGPRESWSRRGETWYPLPERCPAPVDPSALLYLITAPGWLEPGTPRELCVFSSKTFSRARVEDAGTVSAIVGYGLGEGRREGEIEARRITVTPVRIEGAEDEPFELLGLSGQLEILVDLEHGVPVEVRGKLSYAGSVAARLRGVELAGGGSR